MKVITRTVAKVGMSKEELKSVQSPCVSICALDEDDICVGCFRSGDEISHWGTYSDDEKVAVLKSTQQRRLDSGYAI